jgi:hypothetical protein
VKSRDCQYNEMVDGAVLGGDLATFCYPKATPSVNHSLISLLQ